MGRLAAGLAVAMAAAPAFAQDMDQLDALGGQPLRAVTLSAPPPPPAVPRAVDGPPRAPVPVDKLAGATMTVEPSAPPAAGPACVPAGPDRVGLKTRLQACFLGFPGEFEAPPLGASVYAHARAMVAEAESARMVLYQCDFVEGTDRLTCYGRDHLARIACLLPRTFTTVIVERTVGAPDLDEARRLAVLNELGRAGVAVPAERVLVGPAIALGLAGQEAEMVYHNLLIQTQSGGTHAGAGGGSVGGSVGQGFSATGRSSSGQ